MSTDSTTTCVCSEVEYSMIRNGVGLEVSTGTDWKIWRLKKIFVFIYKGETKKKKAPQVKGENEHRLKKG